MLNLCRKKFEQTQLCNKRVALLNKFRSIWKSRSSALNVIRVNGISIFLWQIFADFPRLATGELFNQLFGNCSVKFWRNCVVKVIRQVLRELFKLARVRELCRQMMNLLTQAFDPE